MMLLKNSGAISVADPALAYFCVMRDPTAIRSNDHSEQCPRVKTWTEVTELMLRPRSLTLLF